MRKGLLTSKLLNFAMCFVFALLIGCGGTSNDQTTDTGTGTGTDSGTGTGTVTSTFSATLSWNAPTTDANEAALTDLAGFKVYYGKSAGDFTAPLTILSNSTTVSKDTLTYTLNDLTSGTYCFAVTALDLTGNESVMSSIVSKTSENNTVTTGNCS